MTNKIWEEYKEKIKRGLDLFEFDNDILQILKGSADKKQKIFVTGNGGSAIISMHYACDFGKGANKKWNDKNHNRYQAICLSNNIGYMTAIANDTSYDNVFSEQIQNLASPKDILILISSSGNSPNIIKALKEAKANNMIVIGITGFNGGKLKKLADYSAHIDFDSYEVCEDIHSIFGHFLSVFMRS